MKVLHAYCLNYNLGDYYLGIGVKNLLRKYLKVSLIAETNLQGREFNEYYINEVINKRYDLLVIGGGGVIHGKHWPNGWFWLIDKDLIKTIRIPFIVYGVGYNYWEEEGGIPVKGINHLRETIKYAAYFSVRNDGSALRIAKQTGIKASAIPDPGFHINLESSYERKEDKPYVLIQLANDKPERRFGSLENRESFIEDMRYVTKMMAKAYKVIFAPHVYDDIEISLKIKEGIDNTEVWDFKYFAFDHAEESLAFYEYADFVIAMRGHGQIVPIAFNTPVIALENHPKHRGLMEELDLLGYNVEIGSVDFRSKLVEMISILTRNRSLLQAKYKQINKTLINNSKSAFGVIIKNLND